MAMPTAWTDEDTQTIRDLAPTHSASMLGLILNRTRNAVIGRAHRMGISLGFPKLIVKARPEPKGRAPRHRAPVVPLFSPRPFAAQPVPVICSKPTTFTDLRRDQCAYDLGGPRDPPSLFCGGERRMGSPYCAGHHLVCYPPVVRIPRKRPDLEQPSYFAEAAE